MLATHSVLADRFNRTKVNTKARFNTAKPLPVRMAINQNSKKTPHVSVRNIGGIEQAEVTLSPGVTILTGRNATNRTSFLQALMAGLGSKQSSLKSDAKAGEVTLEIDNQTYTRTLTRRGDAVAFDGEPYLDNPEVADLFAFLLTDNEARQAVVRGDNLHEIIMRPIDTDRIDDEIKAVRDERDEIKNKIDQLEELERELPKLEEKRRETEAELETARTELEELQSELDALDTGVEESRTQKQELEDAFQRVRNAQSDLEDLTFDLETEQSTLSDLEAERDEIEKRLADSEDPETNPDRLSGRIQELRQRKRKLDETINELGSVINFNQEMLENEGFTIDDNRTDPTASLTAEYETTCWTCGSEVETDQIDNTIDRLRELRSSKLDERNELGSKISELTDQKTELENKRERIERDQKRLADVNDEIQTTQDRIEALESQITEQENEIEKRQAEAEAIEIEGHEKALELHREISGLELRIEQLEDELADITDNIADREEKLSERDTLETERENLSEQLTELRTQVERIEKEAVDAFNDHMETVLDILEYDNLDRIWIERREAKVREGRRKVLKTRFDLHIVRSSADGAAYEDSITNLSESEREVIGLVFALAGYLVHEVHKEVPFILLDSVEAIDSSRINKIVDYFHDHADYVVAALLPEDAAALPETHTYVEQID